MRFIQYGMNRLGMLSQKGSDVIDLTHTLTPEGSDPMMAYLNSEQDPNDILERSADASIDDISVTAPISQPGKIVAMVFNYSDHADEMEDIDTDTGYLLKAPSSIIGPDDPIKLPFSGQDYFYEVELAFILGEETKNGVSQQTERAIFGFTILLDITMGGEQHLSIRKSYDTFTVIGPCIVTQDEIPDPMDLELSLAVNGIMKQQGTTADMVYDCGDILEIASQGMTLEVGDIVTTGTPSGVGTFGNGDVITASIEEIGSMTVQVENKADENNFDLPL